jgi:hypothetical protein
LARASGAKCHRACNLVAAGRVTAETDFPAREARFHRGFYIAMLSNTTEARFRGLFVACQTQREKCPKLTFFKAKSFFEFRDFRVDRSGDLPILGHALDEDGCQ